jgi:hypothetical protein
MGLMQAKFCHFKISADQTLNNKIKLIQPLSWFWNRTMNFSQSVVVIRQTANKK